MSDVKNIWNRSSIILKLMSRSTFWISHIHLSRFCRRSQCRFWQKYAQSRSKKIKFDFPLKFVMIIQNFSLLTPMKKITRPLFRILTSFCIISWIYFSQHYFTEKIEKNQSITWEKQDQKSNIFSLSLDPFLSLPSLHKMPTILLSKLEKTCFIETRSTAFKSSLTKNEELPYESNLKKIPYTEKWSHSICNTKENTTFRYQFI